MAHVKGLFIDQDMMALTIKKQDEYYTQSSHIFLDIFIHYPTGTHFFSKSLDSLDRRPITNCLNYTRKPVDNSQALLFRTLEQLILIKLIRLFY